MTDAKRKVYMRKYRANMPSEQKKRHARTAIEKDRQEEYVHPECYADRVLAGRNQDDWA